MFKDMKLVNKVLVGFAALLGQTLKLEHEPWWRHAKLAPYAVTVASWLETFAGESRRLAHRALDARLAAPGTGTEG